MKITAPPAISRLAARFQERRARAAQGERPPLTQADEDNITQFGQIVEQLTGLLGQENDALREADLSLVALLFEQKQALLKRLETRQPVVEPFLRESAEVTQDLKVRIGKLAEQIETNAVLLSAMAEASRNIRQEVNRVRDRHSLKGMYGKSGQALDGGGSSSKKLDTNF